MATLWSTTATTWLNSRMFWRPLQVWHVVQQTIILCHYSFILFNFLSSYTSLNNQKKLLSLGNFQGIKETEKTVHDASSFLLYSSPVFCHRISLTAFSSLSSPPLVLRVSQPCKLRAPNCSSSDHSGHYLWEIPSLHLQTHTGCTRTSHTGTGHRHALILEFALTLLALRSTDVKGPTERLKQTALS